MKRSIGIVVVVAALVIGSFGGTQVAQADNINTSVNLPGLNFSMNSYTQWNGDMTFSASTSSLDRVSGASVSFGINPYDPLQGWVWMNFNGIEGVPATKVGEQSGSMDINYRGFRVSTDVSLGSYQEIVDWTPPTVDGGYETPVYGNWWSTANASVTLSGIVSVIYDGGCEDYPNGGGKGDGPVISETDFLTYAQFRVTFDNLSDAALFGSLGSIQVVATPTPEPAAMSVLALGAIGLIRRRR